MVFSSLSFLLLFLPLVLVLHRCAPRPARNAILLAASLLFYAVGEAWYCLVMLAAIGIGWAGVRLGARLSRAGARTLAGGAIAALLGLLLVFKYAGFLSQNLSAAAAALGLALPAIDPLHLPIGISFFVFQTVSYIVDVRRGDAPAGTLGQVGLYTAFFPQLIAGPIVRWSDLAAQLDGRTADLDGFTAGLRRFVLGLARKVLIADAVAPTADAVFALSPDQLSTGAAWLGATCYAVQIYHDFAGYSDMAIGLAGMFGLRLEENFDRPYAATSIRDFWHRWHRSLSTWFRDYLYIPLGGSRRGGVRTIVNLFIVFLLCGFWHGAQWTFIAWGGFHGLFLAIEHLLRRRTPPPWLALLGRPYAWLVVLVGWVLFRAEDLPHAGRILAAMAGADGTGAAPWWRLADGHLVAMVVVGLLAGVLPLARWRTALAPRVPADGWLAAGTALGVFALTMTALVAGGASPFIYFRF